VGLDTESFPAALRNALREDPDVILVGEMRDLESIRFALTLAETGHHTRPRGLVDLATAQSFTPHAKEIAA
jgi:Tfp pilus assembly pilus retraction ATPase PilT